jgi:hypothetical protein
LPVLRQSGKAKTPRNRRAIFVGLFKSGQTFEKKLNQARSTVRVPTTQPQREVESEPSDGRRGTSHKMNR